jgi:hypothetical protein
MQILDFLKKGWYISRKKKFTKPNFVCSRCQKHLNEGDFIAIIGKAPPTGWSMPIGRADVIYELTGKIYCENCFKMK